MYIYKDKSQINKIKQGRNSIYHKQRNEIVVTKMYIQYMHIYICIYVIVKQKYVYQYYLE